MRMRLLVGVLFALVTAGSNAAVLYDNLNAAPGGKDIILQGGPFEGNSFSTGSSAAELTGLEVRLVLPTVRPTLFNVNAFIAADNNLRPDTSLTSLGNSPISVDSQGPGLSETTLTVSFPQSSPVALSAHARYWILLQGDQNSPMWNWSLDTSGVGVQGEYFMTFGNVFPNDLGAFLMRVSVDTAPVPLPGMAPALAAMLLGFGGTSYFRRRNAL